MGRVSQSAFPVPGLGGWLTGIGGTRVVPHTPDTAEALAVHEALMVEYDAVFRALAK